MSDSTPTPSPLDRRNFVKTTAGTAAAAAAFAGAASGQGIDPDKKINPKEFSAVANWWETTSVQKPAVLAHSVEQLICNHQVASSIPAHGTSLKQESQHNWRLEESKKFTVAPAYNKGAYQVIPRSEIKDIGR